MSIVLYMPSFNERIVCQTPVFEHMVVCDNGGTEVVVPLDYSGLDVIRHERNKGRVGNWSFCLEHFQNRPEEWMKWLFSGDELYPEAKGILEEAARNFPEAGLIVAEYDIVSGGQKTRWRMFEQTRVMEPEESIRLAAEKGNWFGSPIGHTLHKRGLSKASFGHLPWVADMQLCLSIASECPVVYLAETVGAFHVDKRQYYQKQAGALGSLFEEGLIRLEAARLYGERYDEELGKRLELHIEKELEARVVGRRVRRSQNVQDVLHIVQMMGGIL